MQLDENENNNENVANPKEEEPKNIPLREGTFRVKYYLENNFGTYYSQTLLSRYGQFKNAWDSKYHEFTTDEKYNVLKINNPDFIYPYSMFGTISPFYLNSEEYLKVFLNNNLMTMECVFSRAFSPLYNLAQIEGDQRINTLNYIQKDIHKMTTYFFKPEDCS
jgi:hypothetical protein